MIGVCSRAEDKTRWVTYDIHRATWKSSPKNLRGPEPICERLIIGDTTTEAAQEAFKGTNRGMLGVYDEMGGWFGSMDRYGSAGRNAADRAFMLQAYNGGSYIVDRVTRGAIHIDNLSLSILGGIQPDLVRRVTDSPEDDGLVERLTPIMLRPGPIPIANIQASVDADTLKMLIPRLMKLKPPMSGHLMFDGAAQQIQHDLMVEHKELAKHFERVNRKLSTALGKQDGLFARLCVIWHACIHAGTLGSVGDGPLPDTITANTAYRVAAFMPEFTRPHLFDFYEIVLSLPEEHERLQSIAGYILSKGLMVVSNRLVQSAVRTARKLTSKDITPILEQLEAMGWLIRSAPLRGGAPPQWMVNPDVHTVFAARGVLEATRRENARNAITQATATQRHPVDDD